MENTGILEIPDDILAELGKETFGPADIKWIKSVHDTSKGNPSSSSAYLYPDGRVNQGQHLLGLIPKQIFPV